MTIKGPLTKEDSKVTDEALQGALVDLIDLSLVAKQAHWNLVGPRFRSVHLQLDEVVDLARQHTDVVAERLAAIGVSPDGRAATVAARSEFPQLGPEWVGDQAVVTALVETLARAVRSMRERIDLTANADPVTQDLLIAAAGDLEKQSWMWQAQDA